MAKIDQQLFNTREHALEREYEVCPKCGAELHIRHSKHGSFLGCSNYPSCDYNRPLVQHEAIESQPLPGSVCPECGAELAVKSGRFGIFIGCTRYPECKHIEKHDQQPTQPAVTCPQCHHGKLESRTSRFGKTFYACSDYPNCKYLVNYPPRAETCPECGFAILVERRGAGGVRLECPQKNCSFKKLL
ncbi:DNA topoisomerase family protein [Shewanella dokdonensis]|uniref:Topoisomerase DNA-binding C4 zinc finger domain-containing protein n=1 Tax=Shewanella dokdonensis TaxID=712036 RepID=A0ABX8DI74_9GAMM|nr:topoisomerase DNA-binding C4 zinc finger domain-containing protein [Shewanella dokdonensis]MCL1076304.1 topoisomerase DNA-binding C4 zinc finger domain-containing protein [Shewanella dokdonensis]QVK24488.1 topoisomerase DNA-binding C4 zinc finger domain-containing protein [Shewanella dokdonensis]